MSFDLQRIKTETFVEKIEYHREIGSTNDCGLALCSDDADVAPLLILAETQTAGRGRDAKAWWSSRDSLTSSLVLDAAALGLSIDGTPRVSLSAGLAVAEALASLLPDHHIGLKWPNDVWLNERKVCGILVEHVASTRKLVLGIGINVNNALVDAPSELRKTATSLAAVAGRRFDKTLVLIRVLQQMEHELNRLAKGQADLQKRWSPFCVLAGREIGIAVGDRCTRGVCRGIDASGALIVATDAGDQRFVSGQVIPWPL